MKWKFYSHREYGTKESIGDTLVLAIECLTNIIDTIVIVAKLIMNS